MGQRKHINITECGLLNVARNSHSPHVRRAGRRADMGCRTVEGYLRSRQGRIPAAVLPEDQQERRTAQYSAHTGRSGNAPESALRGDAVGTVVLPDTVAADRTALPHNVHADVCRRNRPAVQDEGSEPPVPSGQRQRHDVAARRTGILRFAACIRPEFHSSRADRRRQQHRMVLRADYRLSGRCNSTFHHIRHAQALVERPEGCRRVRPVPLGRAKGAVRSSENRYRQKPGKTIDTAYDT